MWDYIGGVLSAIALVLALALAARWLLRRCRPSNESLYVPPVDERPAHRCGTCEHWQAAATWPWTHRVPTDAKGDGPWAPCARTFTWRDRDDWCQEHPEIQKLRLRRMQARAKQRRRERP